MPARSPQYRYRGPRAAPEERGGKPPVYRRIIENEHAMIIERDVAIPMRDGVKLYADVFRPANEKPVPPIIAWTPYGKHVPFDPRRFINAGVKEGDTSEYTAFEAPDPVFWIPSGYAVVVIDVRGTWYSEGTAHYLAPEEAQDFYHAVEWAGTQPWSSGKVGLSGVSYLAQLQWRVAELDPPTSPPSTRGRVGPTLTAKWLRMAGFAIRISGRPYGTAGVRPRARSRTSKPSKRASALRRFLALESRGFLEDQDSRFCGGEPDRSGPAYTRHLRGLQAHCLRNRNICWRMAKRNGRTTTSLDNMRRLRDYFDHVLKGVGCVGQVQILALNLSPTRTSPAALALLSVGAARAERCARQGYLAAGSLAIVHSNLVSRSVSSVASSDFTYPSSNLARSAASDGVTSPLATAATRTPVALSASAAVVIAGKAKLIVYSPTGAIWPLATGDRLLHADAHDEPRRGQTAACCKRQRLAAFVAVRMRRRATPHRQ